MKASWATGAAAALLTFASPAKAFAGETIARTFTGEGEHAFVVPSAVTSLHVTLVGGHGGAGEAGGSGGAGATVTATIAATPGETLFAEIAGNGAGATEAPAVGGYGGGATGGIHEAFLSTHGGGGGGGGASDVRTCSVTAVQTSCPGGASLDSRLVVAGGGGGGGGAGKNTGAGGSGGAAEITGGQGGNETARGFEGGMGGTRGTAAGGGSPGARSYVCAPSDEEACPAGGGVGTGGIGGASTGGGGGGGGGGGLFGGGGGGGGNGEVRGPTEYFSGGGGGGGGGSSGVPSGVANVSGTLLLATAEGAEPSVSLSWGAPPPTALTGAATAVTQTTATLNGTVDTNAWQPTGCEFTISPGPAGISEFPCVQQLAIGEAPAGVSAIALGLSPGTTYTVALLAATIQGSASGEPTTFTTPATITATSTPTSTSTATATATATAKLAVTNLKLSPLRFRRGRRPATVASRKLPIATTISFTLSGTAAVMLTFEAPQRGVLVGHRCTAASKTHHHGRRCTRFVHVPHGVTLSAPAGSDRIAFDGVLSGGGDLPAGTYRLSLTASAAGGRATASQHPSFTLVS
jgi:hypothetical protein